MLVVWLQYQLNAASRKRLEYEFHSACYHTVMEVLAGLRTSVSHLIKEVSGRGWLSNLGRNKWLSQ